MIKSKMMLYSFLNVFVQVLIGVVALPFLLVTLVSMFVQQELQEALTVCQRCFMRKILELKKMESVLPENPFVEGEKDE